MCVSTEQNSHRCALPYPGNRWQSKKHIGFFQHPKIHSRWIDLNRVKWEQGNISNRKITWNCAYGDRAVSKPLLLTNFNILSNIVLHYYFPFTMSHATQYAHWNVNFSIDWIRCDAVTQCSSMECVCVCTLCVCSSYAIAKYTIIQSIRVLGNLSNRNWKSFLLTNKIGFVCSPISRSFCQFYHSQN